MTDLNKVIAGAKGIEKILVEQFGGTGRGMTEKLNSSRYRIPEPLKKRIKHLAWLRNRSVHEEGFVIQDGDDYLAKCESVCDELLRAHAIAVQAAAKRGPGKGRLLAFAVLALVIYAAWRGIMAPASDAGAQAEPQAPAQGPASTHAAAAPHQGRNAGIGNDVLSIDAVEFRYVKGSFDRLEPELFVTVHNTSDRTISSASVDARLYLDGESKPAIDTTARGDSARLFLGFGDNGLAPGERKREEVSLFGEDYWAIPDAINAKSRSLVLRLKEVSDGRKQAFGAAARAWPVAVTQPPAKAPRGRANAASPTALEVGNVKLALVKGAFDREEPRIGLDVTNHTGAVVSLASFEARLYINGEKEPALVSAEPDMPTASFGQRGLADGETRRDEMTVSTMSGQWDAPDIRNAIRSGRARVVLRLASYTDGRRATHSVDPGAR